MNRTSLVGSVVLGVALASAVVAPVAVLTPEAGSSSHAPTVGLVDPSQGQWHLRDGAGGVKSFFFGNPGDFPIMGDWDCDGFDTPGTYRQSDGFVYLSNENRSQVADIRFFFGNPGDVPLAGDFNDDGCDTVSIYRPATGRFFIINKLGQDEGGLGAAETDYLFGNPGDKPFVGDFDGDGVETVGLHRESTGLVYFRQSHTQGAADAQFIFGDPGDRLVAGDWNGNGSDSPALFRPSNTTFFFRYTNTQGVADDLFAWGESSWLPVSGKFGVTGMPPTSTTTTTTLPTLSWPSCGFAAFSLTGSGDAVPALAVPGDEPAILDISHTGTSNFAVWTVNASFDNIDLLVNEIGSYQGIRPTNHWGAEEKVRYLEITADGAWRVDVRTFCSARIMTANSIDGAGDEVILVSQGGPATFTHNGSSNFFVWSYQSSSSRDLEVNEIGPFSGQELIDAGTVFLEIGADGIWTVNFP